MNAPALRPDSAATSRLLERAARGELAAVDELLAHHRDDMKRYIELHLDLAVRGRLDPSDIVQEAQMVMSRRLADYLVRRPMPFHLWARRTAHDRVVNARRDHRAARRDVAREAPGLNHSSELLADRIVAPGPSPSDTIAAHEQCERVAVVIETLPESDREILLLRLVDELPYDEIACLLDIALDAARQRYGRALLRLNDAISSARVSVGP